MIQSLKAYRKDLYAIPVLRQLKPFCGLKNQTIIISSTIISAIFILLQIRRSSETKLKPMHLIWNIDYEKY